MTKTLKEKNETVQSLQAQVRNLTYAYKQEMSINLEQYTEQYIEQVMQKA